MPNINLNSLSGPNPFDSCSETFRESLRQMADDLAAKKAAKAAQAARPKVCVAMEQSEVGEDVETISVSDEGSPKR